MEISYAKFFNKSDPSLKIDGSVLTGQEWKLFSGSK